MADNNKVQVIMNVTHSCNLACRYCYYREEMSQKPGNMSLPTVEMVFKQLAKSSFASVNISIHGGEPLLRDTQFYNDFFGLQLKYLHDKEISNSIQTNGTLIDECFIDNYLKLTGEGINLGIGLSLDGPREIHDFSRLYRKGLSGSFDDILKNINLLEKHGIDIAVLAVAPLQMAERANVLYDFFKSIKNMHFLDLLVPKYDAIPTVSDDSLSRVYNEVFDDWFFDENAFFNIRYYANFILAFLTGRGNICTSQADCFSNKKMISVGPDGSISFCDSLPDYTLGNVWGNDVDSLIDKNNRIRRRQSIKEAERLETCMFCKWYNICGGDCPYNHVPGSGKVQYWCEEYQKIFEHLEDKVRSIQISEKDGLNEEVLEKIINPSLKAYLVSLKKERKKSHKIKEKTKVQVLRQ